MPAARDYAPIEHEILREVRRRLLEEKQVAFQGAFPGDKVGPRITAFGRNPDLEGCVMVDVAREARL